METDAQAFRRQVLEAVHAAQAQRAGGYLHLVYSPELADPLQLLDDSRRKTALIRPANLDKDWNGANFPRLITLDCRRVAAFMLETDAALDDPLFEASIVQAHAEVCLGERANLAVINDNPGPSESAVCGWIASRQDAPTLARRMAHHSYPLRPGSYHRWLRWHNPIYLSALWSTLSPAQQRALLGDACWVAHDPVGELRNRQADMTGVKENEVEVTFRPSEEQWQRYDDAPGAAQLVRNWQAQCLQDRATLPPDAIERLYKHLADARRLRLRGDDRAIYAMTLARLPDESARLPEWVALLSRVDRRETTLRDGLSTLPDHFWNPPAPGAGIRAAGMHVTNSNKEVTI